MDVRGFHVMTSHEGERATLSLVGELDLSGVEQLEAAIRNVCAIGRPFTIDLTRLDFIDSSGLKVLVSLHNAATAGGPEYTLIAGPPAVQRMFVLTGLDQTLSFSETASGLSD